MGIRWALFISHHQTSPCQPRVWMAPKCPQPQCIPEHPPARVSCSSPALAGAALLMQSLLLPHGWAPAAPCCCREGRALNSITAIINKQTSTCCKLKVRKKPKHLFPRALFASTVGTQDVSSCRTPPCSGMSAGMHSQGQALPAEQALGTAAGVPPVPARAGETPGAHPARET